MSRAPFHAERVGARVSSVSEFVLQIRNLIEASCPLGWVGGEISNLVRAASGHLYFTLKDERAQLRCTMWRSKAALLPFQLAEGMQVEVRAQATVYEARGDLQLSVEGVRRAGLGSLFEAFLRLKAKLEAEGLFDPSRKRPLPPLPKGVGVITSTSGAVLHDVLTTLRRRAPSLPITVYPSPVQGDAAGPLIAAAITQAGQRAALDGCEILIICRGGGSAEDLWAFNHESVARALAACPIPVISGVGHETDTTLADFAADLRAPTPTAAAELVSTGLYNARQRMPQLQAMLLQSMERRLQRATQRADELQRRLLHPSARLKLSHEQLTRLRLRLELASKHALQKKNASLASSRDRLYAHRPDTAQPSMRLEQAAKNLNRATQWRLNSTSKQLLALTGRLAALNPEAVLARGYAIVRDERGAVIRDASRTHDGERINVQLAAGLLRARIEKS